MNKGNTLWKQQAKKEAILSEVYDARMDRQNIENRPGF